MTDLQLFIQGIWESKFFTLLPFILLFTFTGIYEAIERKWDKRASNIKQIKTQNIKTAKK